METGELVDLAIVGAGPAGCAAALEARRLTGSRAAIAVFDRDRFPRDKVCGEFVSGEALPLVERWAPAALASSPRISRSEFVSPRGRVHRFRLSRPARGLSRFALDDALWRAVANLTRVVAREGDGVRALRRQGEGWWFETDMGRNYRALHVILACGRWWSLDGFPSPARANGRTSHGPWMGAKAHFTGLEPRDAVEMYFFPGGYCGLAPIENGLYNACCLVHRDLVKSSGASGVEDIAAWLKAVARHAPLDERLRGGVQVSKTVSTAPLMPSRRRAACDGALLAGDAAGFLDPFTGDGISMALHSGCLAGREIARGLKTAASSAVIAQAFSHRLRAAVHRSYLIAGLIRALVRMPAGIQDSAAGVLARFGTQLNAQTRWNSATCLSSDGLESCL